MFLVTVIFNSTTLVAFLTRLVHFRALYNISFELKSVVSVLRMIDKCPNIFLLNLLVWFWIYFFINNANLSWPSCNKIDPNHNTTTTMSLKCHLSVIVQFGIWKQNLVIWANLSTNLFFFINCGCTANNIVISVLLMVSFWTLTSGN